MGRGGNILIYLSFSSFWIGSLFPHIYALLLLFLPASLPSSSSMGFLPSSPLVPTLCTRYVPKPILLFCPAKRILFVLLTLMKLSVSMLKTPTAMAN